MRFFTRAAAIWRPQISSGASCIPNSLDLRDAVLRSAGEDFEIRQRFCHARAVRVAAEDGHLAVGVGRHGREQQIADGFAGEMGGPFVVGQSALVPTGFQQRRNVRGHVDFAMVRQRRRQHSSQLRCRFVPQSL